MTVPELRQLVRRLDAAHHRDPDNPRLHQTLLDARNRLAMRECGGRREFEDAKDTMSLMRTAL